MKSFTKIGLGWQEQCGPHHYWMELDLVAFCLSLNNDLRLSITWRIPQIIELFHFLLGWHKWKITFNNTPFWNWCKHYFDMVKKYKDWVLKKFIIVHTSYNIICIYIQVLWTKQNLLIFEISIKTVLFRTFLSVFFKFK